MQRCVEAHDGSYVDFVTEILKTYSPSKKSEPMVPSTFDGTPVSQEEFEAFLEKNWEKVRFNGFNKTKNAFEYIREDRCPWEAFHEQPNGDDDFAIYIQPVSNKPLVLFPILCADVGMASVGSVAAGSRTR